MSSLSPVRPLAGSGRRRRSSRCEPRRAVRLLRQPVVPQAGSARRRCCLDPGRREDRRRTHAARDGDHEPPRPHRGGNETARHTVSAAVLTATDKQPFWTALRRRDADVGVATEEMLRFETPVSHVLRVPGRPQRGWGDRARRRCGHAVGALGQPGRGGLPGGHDSGPSSTAQPASGVRARPALLHRGRAGPDRGGGVLRTMVEPGRRRRGGGAADPLESNFFRGRRQRPGSAPAR